jgi:crotonobetainyl-CoA:carnitine CoA-transferase CaiB-like acyl-CoA transferase
MSLQPLEGMLVVSLEHAVAAPYCSSRLAQAGARVLKIERPEGDFARDYDREVYGESSYFVWINQGKESVALDLRQSTDMAQMMDLLAQADVFIQNLAPGAAKRLGLGSDTLRAAMPRLITCDISGYGESGPMNDLKAYDLLVQAESGLVSVNGAPGPWGRIGVSICDITAGMNAAQGILEALLLRERTGQGSALHVSLFDAAAELMAVPYLQARYGRSAPERGGLKHPSIAAYGAFTCSDGRELVLAVQNDREWRAFCQHVMEQPKLILDVRFVNSASRGIHRQLIEDMIQAVIGALTWGEVTDRLTEAQTPFGTLNSVLDLIHHPQLRTQQVIVRGRPVEMPAPACQSPWQAMASLRGAPAVDEHGQLTDPLQEKAHVS